MTEPTSHFFIARVGAAAPDLESRLVQWASTSCQAHCVVRDVDGRIALYLHRKDAKAVRAMQSLIRTLTAPRSYCWPIGSAVTLSLAPLRLFLQ